MKIKKGFAKREIAGAYIVVPVGAQTDKFNGMITLNESGSFFWDCLKEETTAESAVEKITQQYDVDYDTAKADFDKFTTMLRENGILES